MYVLACETLVFKIKVFFPDMRCLVMFVTTVCLLFLRYFSGRMLCSSEIQATFIDSGTDFVTNELVKIHSVVVQFGFAPAENPKRRKKRKRNNGK